MLQPEPRDEVGSSFETLKRIVSQAREVGARFVDFTGGEMTAMAALELLLEPNSLDFDIAQGQVIVGDTHHIQDRVITRIYQRPLNVEPPEAFVAFTEVRQEILCRSLFRIISLAWRAFSQARTL